MNLEPGARPPHLPTCRCGGLGVMAGDPCPVNDGKPLTDEEWRLWHSRNRRTGYNPPARSTVEAILAEARANLGRPRHG